MALFLRDEGVPAVVDRVLREKGHNVESVTSLNMMGAQDDDLVIWADDRGAYFLFHDKGIASRAREKVTYGRLVLLKCEPHEAPALVDQYVDEIVAIGERRSKDGCIFRVQKSEVKLLWSTNEAYGS